MLEFQPRSVSERALVDLPFACLEYRRKGLQGAYYQALQELRRA